MLRFFEKISAWVSKWMAAIVIVVAALAFIRPATCSWIKTSAVNPLLGIVMFGMGLTLKPADFKVVFSRPRDIITGFLAQFLLMPLIAFVLIKIFQLPTEIAIGVMLVGTCPGGTSSNVMTFMAHGDVPLSVGMTAVSTVFAPFLTPFLTWFYLRATVEVNMVAMFLSIVQVVLIPIVLGFVVNYFFSKFTQAAVKVLPLVSTIAIVAIVAAVVAANAGNLRKSSVVVFVVVILHNLLGYFTGYMVGKLLKTNESKARTLSIEVGMQNSGLAVSLARTAFAQYPMAMIPGAVFSTWHNISGAIYANFLAQHKPKDGSGDKTE